MTTSQMRAKRGEIWLVRFPFTDLSSTKVRPAVVWAVFGEDAVVVGVFSSNSWQIAGGRAPNLILRVEWDIISMTNDQPLVST